ncbi:MAG: Hsp70 family protein, partial [Caulobacteraceae bacterium]
LVSPELGKGSSYSVFGKVLPTPARWYAAFARWEQLALLAASADMREIRAMRRTALEPEKIAALVEILDDNHAYRLYQAVSETKVALSSAERAPFLFAAGSVRIEADVSRGDFEAWIGPELAAIEAGVEAALERAGIKEGAIDRVFLTGGSSFVPAVRRIFERRFGLVRLEGGAELVSIASGLALIAAEADPSPWFCEEGLA